MKSDLPPRVFEKSGTFWYVKAIGAKRKWLKLCRVKEGLPAMYLALSKLTTEKAMEMIRAEQANTARTGPGEK